MIRPVRKALFWTSAGLIAYTHAGYPLALKALAALRGARDESPRDPAELPSVSLIIAAYDEAAVIERKIENALALDYPRERLEIVVASDGSSDDTVELAQKAGADRVLDLPRGGKLAAQNAAVREAEGDVLAFSDANSWWEPDALRHLVAALSDEGVGYACGEVVFTDAGGDNQEGVYWRYEMGCGSSSPRSEASRPATARSTRCGGRTTSSSSRAPATISPSRSGWRRTACAPSTSRRRARPSGWSRRSRASGAASGG